MKNMKYLSLLAILGLLVGCTSDLTTEEVPQPPSVPEQKISHVVPVEQALEDLQGLLEAIDAPAEDGAVTRSGGIRRVKNVTTVSPEALSPGGTRSEATADVEDLLYIVNFENEAGYAILGADDRLEPVYAVVDEGSHNGYYYVGAFNTAKSPVTLGVSSTGPGDFSNDNEIMMYML